MTVRPIALHDSQMRHGTQTLEELSRFRVAMDMCGDAIYLVDRATMRFVDVNHTACTRMGYSREELLQMGPQDLLAVSREEIERLYDEAIAAGAGGTTTESAARAKDGHATVTELHRRALRMDGGWIIVSIARDITERKLLEERVQHVAHHDSLTGLPNRLLFNDRLTQSINLSRRDSRQFALLYLDLDRFKPVNDALGHRAGDELLQAVATRIRREVRESDTVARIGGDEFIVILPGISGREQAKAIAGKITAALGAPFQLGARKQRVEIGISIGIAVYPADARDADTLVNAADAAMYSAKQAKDGVASG